MTGENAPTPEMSVVLLTVGDELLSGETANTNATWLASRLHERGARLRRIVVLPDERDQIAGSLNRLRSEYDAVIVTGGLGPTHDDVTMEAVADAFDDAMVENPDAIEWIENETEYARSDLVDGTTKLPATADFLPNPAGVAPGAVLDNVYVLPGVPEEMREMFSLIAPAFTGPTASTAVLTSDQPESELVEALREASEQFDVRIGSYPGEMVTVRIQGQNVAEVEAAAAFLEPRL